jgi:predicted flap endonuclease-1-like 5' DNA nuclease
MSYLLLQTFLLLLAAYFAGAFTACLLRRALQPAAGLRPATVPVQATYQPDQAPDPAMASQHRVAVPPPIAPRDFERVQPRIDILARPEPRPAPPIADISRFDRALSGPELNEGMPRVAIVEIRPAVLEMVTGPALPWPPPQPPAPPVPEPDPEPEAPEVTLDERPPPPLPIVGGSTAGLAAAHAAAAAAAVGAAQAAVSELESRELEEPADDDDEPAFEPVSGEDDEGASDDHRSARAEAGTDHDEDADVSGNDDHDDDEYRARGIADDETSDDDADQDEADEEAGSGSNDGDDDEPDLDYGSSERSASADDGGEDGYAEAGSSDDDGAEPAPAPAFATTRPAALITDGDDLQRIRAIDEDTEQRLKANGVLHFFDIAKWTADDVELIDVSLDLDGRIDREQWVEQAQILAKGGETYYSRNRAATVRAQSAMAPQPAAQSAAAPPSGQNDTVTSETRHEQGGSGKSVAELAAAAAAAIAAASASVTRGIRPIEPISPLSKVDPNIQIPARLTDAIRAREHDNAAASAPVAASPAPASAEPGDGEDLKRIRGIGVLIEKRLNALGVNRYSHIANWSNADVDRISQTLDFKGRIEREGWIQQARILASGGHTEFSRRVDRGEVDSSSRD